MISQVNRATNSASESPTTHDQGGPAIKARGLGQRFGRRWALAHFDLDLGPGESLLLAGANGSGKTTFLRLVAGLSAPTAGSIEIFGKSPQLDRRESRQLLSLVSHDAYLYDRLTALEMLRVWSQLLGADASDESLQALLAEVGLEDRRDSRIHGFSAGMRKRLTLLRTRIEQPRIVLLDEPFAALDPAGRTLIETWVKQFRESGTSVVISSHVLERSRDLVERAVVLREGQAAWQGAARDLPLELVA